MSDLAATPLELLTNKGDRVPTFLNDKWNTMLGSVMGFGFVCFLNWTTRRPLLSGVQKHIAAVLGGGSLAYYIDQKRDAYLADRDAVWRHYIELHPDDFPPFERKKIGETIERWVPIR